MLLWEACFSGTGSELALEGRPRALQHVVPHFPRVKIFSSGSDRAVMSSNTYMFALLCRLKLRAT